MKSLFSAIAHRYDRMNHVLSLGQDVRWRRAAAKLVCGHPSAILDLACGTGDFSFALARRFPEADILGADLTPAMLKVAHAKNHSPRISFIEADAQNLANRQAGIFDLVSCAFGFRNFQDKAAALDEAKHALVPGGQLLILEFFRPQSRLLGRATDLWLRMLSGIFARGNAAAYAYLRNSVKKTVSERTFMALTRDAGFSLEARRFFFPCCTCLLFRETDRPSQRQASPRILS